jgi:hypothetical protein
MPLYIPYSEELRLRGLKAERRTLWKRFEENPSEIHLAAELKIIDDQIAQPYQQNDGHDNKLDDAHVAAVPEVEGVYLLLALSQRVGSQARPAHSRSRNSASERASHDRPILAAQVSNGNATATAQMAMLRPNRTVEEGVQELKSQKMALAFRDAGSSRRGRNQRKACRVDQDFQSQNRSTITK